MSLEIDILAIDDDKLSQKIIRKTLESRGMFPRVAGNGEEGLAEAERAVPDIILLDVEMPGINGYEVCDRLRHNEQTKDVPVVFLSSHSSLRERLQGYEVGADDYLVKPFEPDNLIARIKVLIKYHQEQLELKAQYELAQKTAFTAMTGSSELGLAMQFVEKSYAYRTFDELSQGLFEVTDHLQLSCCLLILSGDQQHWFSSEGSIKPLEKELIEMAEKDKRFFDFGTRTIVNYQNLSLLAKDMPLDDMDRYGRVKDLLPVLLSAVNSKISALNVEHALAEQSKELLRSFGRIRTSFYYLAKTLMENQEHSSDLLRQMLNELNFDLMRMGLDDDQEEYLLNRIDTAVEEVIERIDAGRTIHDTFYAVLANLKEIMSRQEELVDAFAASQVESVEAMEENYEGDIELF
jgi:DNA-binding response OmpR family regulator